MQTDEQEAERTLRIANIRHELRRLKMVGSVDTDVYRQFRQELTGLEAA